MYYFISLIAIILTCIGYIAATLPLYLPGMNRVNLGVVALVGVHGLSWNEG